MKLLTEMRFRISGSIGGNTFYVTLNPGSFRLTMIFNEGLFCVELFVIMTLAGANRLVACTIVEVPKYKYIHKNYMQR